MVSAGGGEGVVRGVTSAHPPPPPNTLVNVNKLRHESRLTNAEQNTVHRANENTDANTTHNAQLECRWDGCSARLIGGRPSRSATLFLSFSLPSASVTSQEHNAATDSSEHSNKGNSLARRHGVTVSQLCKTPRKLVVEQ